MAKHETKVVAQRVKKNRTAAQIASDRAKKAENMRLAAQRKYELDILNAQKAEQRKLAPIQYREQVEANLAEQTAKEQAILDRMAKEMAEKTYVENALAGPMGNLLRVWLKTREATFQRVHKFMNSDKTLQKMKVAQKLAA